MTKNSVKIKAGIRELASNSFEVISGKVVAGSVNTAKYTMTVQITEHSEPIPHVKLSAVAQNGNGLVLFPKDNSDVVIGSVDGPGEWTLLQSSDLDKVLITIGNVIYEMDETKFSIQNGGVAFDIGSSVFKINTPAESLYQLLSDLITAITLLTVSTSTGPSGVPINVSTFTTLLTRLNNLLSP